MAVVPQFTVTDISKEVFVMGVEVKCLDLLQISVYVILICFPKLLLWF